MSSSSNNLIGKAGVQLTREDVETVLSHLDQENQVIDNELNRVKLNHEQRMIELLMERGSKKMLVPLIRQIDELSTNQRDEQTDLRQECKRLEEENRWLKAKLEAVAYELSKGTRVRLKRGRLQKFINGKSSDEYKDLREILRVARRVGLVYQDRQRVSKPLIRELSLLTEEFDQNYS